MERQFSEPTNFFGHFENKVTNACTIRIKSVHLHEQRMPCRYNQAENVHQKSTA